MRYCKACGKDIADDARYCPVCGTDQCENNNVSNTVIYEPKNNDGDLDAATIILAIIGFIIPFIGILGALAMLAGGKSKTAGIVGIATVIGFFFWLFFWGY